MDLAPYYCGLCKHWHRTGAILDDHKCHAAIRMRTGKLPDYDVEELLVD